MLINVYLRLLKMVLKKVISTQRTDYRFVEYAMFDDITGDVYYVYWARDNTLSTYVRSEWVVFGRT